MTRKRNTTGLKVGGITPETQQKGLEAIQAKREFEQRVKGLAQSDPYAAYREMHEHMTAHMLKLLKEEARDGNTPNSAVTDRLREYRQLTDSLASYLEAKGKSEQAAEFFEALDVRLAQANLSELSPTGPSESHPSNASDSEGEQASYVEAGQPSAHLS